MTVSRIKPRDVAILGVVALGIIVLIMIVAAAAQTNAQSEKRVPEAIYYLDVERDPVGLRCSFQLEDRNGYSLAADGYVTITIGYSNGLVLHRESFFVKAGDFVHENLANNNGQTTYYRWMINDDKLGTTNTANLPSNMVAYMTFTYGNGPAMQAYGLF